MVLGPLLVWWACKILKLTAGRAAYAGALSIFYWWSSDLSEIAVTNGSVEFQITATGSLVVIADFLSFCETRASAPAAIALLAISTLCLWLHRSRSPSPLPSNRVCVISATDVPAKNRLSCLMELATESAERRFLERVSSSSSSNARFLEALASVQPTHQAVVELDRLSRGRIVGHKRIARFNPLSPDNARLFAAALHGRQLLSGFRNRNLAALLDSHPATTDVRRRREHTSRLIAKLRGHRLIAKVTRSRLYRVTPRGHHLMSALLTFRHIDFPKAFATAA